MASIASYTKAQLRDHIAMLEGELVKKGRTIAELREQLSIATRNAPRPQVQRPLPLGFQRAREAAMASGRSVRVQGD